MAKGGNFGSLYSASGLRYDAAMRHDTALGATTMRSAHAAGARVAIQILYRDWKRSATRPYVATQRCDTLRQRAHVRSDTPVTLPRHDIAQATIRSGEGHDTASPARSVRSLGHGCVHTVHLTQF